MGRTHIELDPFDPNYLDNPQALETILSYVDQVQRELGRVDRELDTLRQQEGELRVGLSKLDEQLRLASRLQHGLLPLSLPVCSGVRFHRLYCPAHLVSGDAYDVVRLSDHQLAVSLADATGHGMSAAMLSMFIKHSLRAGQAAEPHDPIAPDNMLHKLNRELLQADLSDCQFVTSIYAVYDESDRRVTWARGGMPYPILIRRDQAPTQIISEGGLIGISEDTRFELSDTVLQPGDMLMFYSDGLDALLLDTTDGGVCLNVLETEWGRLLAHAPVAALLEAVEERIHSTPEGHWPADDVTLLIIEAID